MNSTKRLRKMATVLSLAVLMGASMTLSGCAAGGRALGFRLEMAIAHPKDLQGPGRLIVEEINSMAAAQARIALAMLAEAQE